MGKVAAYHTDSPEYGKNREVHHDRDDCFEGRKIERKHLKSGDGNKPKCKECTRLG